MLKVSCLLVFLVGVYLGHVHAYQYTEMGCNFEGKELEDGETYLSPETCYKCTCYEGYSMHCESPTVVKEYPPHCKVLRDPVTCEVRVVMASNEDEPCDGPWGAVGRR